jgi:hypothetical protein
MAVQPRYHVFVYSLFLLAGSSAHGQDESPKEDRRLHARVRLSLRNPTFQELCKALREATGVQIAVDETLANHTAGYAFKVENLPVWSVMDQMVKMKVANGHWERTGDGYRFVGEPSATTPPDPARPTPPPPSPSRLVYWLIALGIVTVLLAWGLKRFLGPAANRSAAEPDHTVPG